MVYKEWCFHAFYTLFLNHHSKANTSANMSNIINKIFGRDDDSESHSQSHKSHDKIETYTSLSANGGEKRTQRLSSGGDQITEGRTVQHEGVNIKSTISSDTKSTVSLVNQQKLNDLVSKLGSTHTQIDQYAKKQTARINAEIQSEIDEVVARTRREQDQLLRQANEHTAQIDDEYRAQLQQMVERIDGDKARRIGEVEQLLNEQQRQILELARTEIDQLNQKAANLKIGALQQAQARAANDASEITAQAAHLGQASTIHQSKGTTTIKTEISANTTKSDAAIAAIVPGTDIESQRSTNGTQTRAETRTIETSRTNRVIVKNNRTE